MQKATIVAVLMACVSSAGAQNEAAIVELVAPAALPVSTVERRVIRLRNVSPQMAAWALDSSHNTRPTMYEIADKLNQTWTHEAKTPEAIPSLKRPVGVEVVTTDEEHNSLIAYGAPGALDDLEIMVRQMDVPLRQVEVEAHFVEVSNAEVTKLNLSFQPVVAPPGVPGDVKAQVALWKRGAGPLIEAWTAAGKAKLITAPRIMAIDGLPASIETISSTSAGLQVSDGLHPPVLLQPQYFSVHYPRAGSAIGMAILPRIVGQTSIALDLYAGKWLSLSTGEPAGAKPDATYSSQLLGGAGLIAARLTLEDGETAIFSGITSQMFSAMFPGERPFGKFAKNRQVLIFVTPRIIRRLGSEN